MLPVLAARSSQIAPGNKAIKLIDHHIHFTTALMLQLAERFAVVKKTTKQHQSVALSVFDFCLSVFDLWTVGFCVWRWNWNGGRVPSSNVSCSNELWTNSWPVSRASDGSFTGNSVGVHIELSYLR